MAMRIASPLSHSSQCKSLLPISNGGLLKSVSSRNSLLKWQSVRRSRAITNITTCARVEEQRNSATEAGSEWGKVSAVLFDMDGVLYNSEVLSRKAAFDLFSEMGVDAQPRISFLSWGRDW